MIVHIVWWAFHQSGCGWKGLRRNALSRSCWFASLSLAKNQFRPLILQKWLLEAYDCAYSLVGFSSEWVWVEGSKAKCLEPFLLVCFPKFGKKPI